MLKPIALTGLLLTSLLSFVPAASASCATFGPLTVTPEDCVGEGVGLVLREVGDVLEVAGCVGGVIEGQPVPNYPGALLACL
jgi:hypothetical protein